MTHYTRSRRGLEWFLTVAALAALTLAAVWFTPRLGVPANIGVIVYKVHLVTLGALIAWVINEYFVDIESDVAQAIILLAVIHGLTGGL